VRRKLLRKSSPLCITTLQAALPFCQINKPSLRGTKQSLDYASAICITALQAALPFCQMNKPSLRGTKQSLDYESAICIAAVHNRSAYVEIASFLTMTRGVAAEGFSSYLVRNDIMWKTHVISNEPAGARAHGVRRKLLRKSSPLCITTLQAALPFCQINKPSLRGTKQSLDYASAIYIAAVHNRSAYVEIASFLAMTRGVAAEGFSSYLVEMTSCGKPMSFRTNLPGPERMA
jgi:hypothetical protein